MRPATIWPAAPPWRPAICAVPPTISKHALAGRARTMPICAARCSSCCSAAASSTAPWRRPRRWTRAAPPPTRWCCCWPWTPPGGDRRRTPVTLVRAAGHRQHRPGRSSRCCWPGRVSPPARTPRRLEALAEPGPESGSGAAARLPSGRHARAGRRARATVSTPWRATFPDLGRGPGARAARRAGPAARGRRPRRRGPARRQGPRRRRPTIRSWTGWPRRWRAAMASSAAVRDPRDAAWATR